MWVLFMAPMPTRYSSDELEWFWGNKLCHHFNTRREAQKYLDAYKAKHPTVIPMIMSLDELMVMDIMTQ